MEEEAPKPEYQGNLFGGFEPATNRSFKKRCRKADPPLSAELRALNESLKRRMKDRAEKIRTAVGPGHPSWYLTDEALKHNK